MPQLQKTESDYYNPHTAELQEVVPVTLSMSRVALRSLEGKGVLEDGFVDKLTDDSRNLAESAVDRSEKRKKIEEMMIDPLTGAFTRRKFNEDIKDLFERKEKGTTLIMVDLLGVNRVNDDEEFGSHALGDAYIKQGVEALNDEDRPLDRIYRLGGDEFAVLIPSINPGDGTYIDALNSIVNRFTVKGNKSVSEFMNKAQLPERMRLGVSVGGYVYEGGDSISIPKAMNAADGQMMNKKREFYASLPPEEQALLKK